MLKVERLYSGYDKALILKDVSLTVKEKELVVVLGANGSGKTTLMITLAGILKPVSGRIEFYSHDITKLEPYERVKKGLALCLERRRLFLSMSVIENVLSGAYLRRDRKSVVEDLSYIYDLFPIIKERKNQLAGTLSGGEQQMVAIARALMSKPRLLMLDEPSVGLAPIMKQKVFDKVQEIKEREGISILVTEQDASILPFADRAYILEHGQISIQGKGEELLKDARIKASYLGV